MKYDETYKKFELYADEICSNFKQREKVFLFGAGVLGRGCCVTLKNMDVLQDSLIIIRRMLSMDVEKIM